MYSCSVSLGFNRLIQSILPISIAVTKVVQAHRAIWVQQNFDDKCKASLKHNFMGFKGPQGLVGLYFNILIQTDLFVPLFQRNIKPPFLNVMFCVV